MDDFLSANALILIAILKVVVVVLVLLTAVAYLTWFERKVVAHMQSRWGPERVGPHGLLQPLADGAKFLFKEDPTPAGIDRFVYFLAPFLALSLALSTIAVIPLGPGQIKLFGHRTWFSISELNISLLVVFAITALSVYGVALAGWASNSKYPLMGGLRSSAQMLSYELSLTMSVVGIVLLTNTFSLRDIVEAQRGTMWGFLPRWFVFPQLIGFVCFFISALAETNRVPFDLPEAETELVAGFHTEYASFKFAMFFMAEYAAMVTVSFMVAVLFFGGYLSPFPETPGFQKYTIYLPAAAATIGGVLLLLHGLRYHTAFGRIVLPVLGAVLAGAGILCAMGGVIEYIQGPFWLAAKVATVLFVYVWVRGTLPRFRYDQLMNFGWKFLLPLSLANLVITSLIVALRPAQ
ncbi:MAG TPA: complex I subunit 1 family protein [Candidatus Acidoferrales bacterium]|nr:complex I subunit 1 family protein [Candidatus Acidoferrales bacterium]